MITNSACLMEQMSVKYLLVIINHDYAASTSCTFLNSHRSIIDHHNCLGTCDYFPSDIKSQAIYTQNFIKYVCVI